jgi:hypothetical protein
MNEELIMLVGGKDAIKAAKTDIHPKTKLQRRG